MFTPSKNDLRHQIARPDRYVVYGWQRSYFTHKLMAALRFYGADWEYRDKTSDNAEEIRLRSGTHQVPVLHTPENWMIADTTPLLHLLDARHPYGCMFPPGFEGIQVQILEEFFDEWVARTTVHWRWNYPENHELLSMDAAHGDAEKARELVVWGGKVCRATGVSSAHQQAAAEAEYFRIMAAAETQLKETPYLLGARPTAVDCIVLAGLRAHFLYDPAPRKALDGKFTIVQTWCNDEADKWDGDGAPISDIGENGFSACILNEMAASYAAFALGNRDALNAGDKAFVASIHGEAVSYLARPYIEESRMMIVRRIQRELDSTGRDLLVQWLGSDVLESVFLE